MATTAFNAQAAVRRLRDSGVAEEPADAIVETIREAGEDLATKADLAQLRSDVKADLYYALWVFAGGIVVVLASLFAIVRIFGL